jgi:hypothetical protein
MLLTMVLLTARAGTPMRFGFKGGFELTEMNFNSNALRESNRMGYYMGPVMYFGLSTSGQSIDAAALYSKRKLKVEDENVPQKCILLPVNLRFGVEVGDVATIFASAGPQISFNIGDDIYYWKEEDDNTNRQFLMQNTLVSFNLGVGIQLEKHLEAGVYYNVPMGKAADFSWDKLAKELQETTWNSAKTKTNAWHVSVTYYF